MKNLAIISMMAIFVFGCNAQKKDNTEIAQNITKDTEKVTPPKGNWEVSKEVDENGNIIRYDSIYSWSSSDDLKGFNRKQMDSVMQSFQSRFSQHFSSSMAADFPDIFQQDSTLMKQFFNDDFFGDEGVDGFSQMDKIREHMEAMQQQFLQRRQPLIPAVPEKEQKSN